MASVYQRKDSKTLWANLKNEAGQWRGKATPYAACHAGDEFKKCVECKKQKRLAERYTTTAQSEIDRKRTGDTCGPITVAKYLDQWTDGRTGRVASAPVDHSRLTRHAMPALGHIALVDVTPIHVRDLVRAMRKTTMAPRSQLHVVRTLSTMFRSAKREGLIAENPVDLDPGELPDKADKDPTWRSEATFSVREVERLISDPSIPIERRVQYAIKAIGGLRHGEVAALTWNKIEPAEPLSRLKVELAWCARTRTIKGTKTGDTRAVPVHPVLAKILAEWRLSGWASVYGRMPTDADYVVPARTMRPQSTAVAVKAFKKDLERLGMRVKAGTSRARGGHDLRSWYMTRMIEDGADGLIIQRTTHAPPKDVKGGYQRFSWAATCREVSKLKVEILDGAVIPLTTLLATPKAVAASARGRWVKSGSMAEAHGNRTLPGHQ